MEGRFREASQKWGRGGARGRAVRAARTREAKGHRPGPTRRALPSMAGRGRGERDESPALGEWEYHTALPPEARSRQPKIAAWSAGRRSVPFVKGTGRVSVRGAAVGAVRRSAPLVCLRGKRRKAHPAPQTPSFCLRGKRRKAHPAPQTIRAIVLGCLIFASLSVRARASGHPEPITPHKSGPPLARGRTERVQII
jgi:hypothetical protein